MGWFLSDSETWCLDLSSAIHNGICHQSLQSHRYLRICFWILPISLRCQAAACSWTNLWRVLEVRHLSGRRCWKWCGRASCLDPCSNSSRRSMGRSGTTRDHFGICLRGSWATSGMRSLKFSIISTCQWALFSWWSFWDQGNHSISDSCNWALSASATFWQNYPDRQCCRIWGGMMNYRPWRSPAMLWSQWISFFIFLWFLQDQTFWPISCEPNPSWKTTDCHDFWRLHCHTLLVGCWNEHKRISIHQQWVSKCPLLNRRPSWVRNRPGQSLFVLPCWTGLPPLRSGCNDLFAHWSTPCSVEPQRRWKASQEMGFGLSWCSPGCYRFV